jgi:tRNA-2-methylthio-N6-dimethylallyladenosine synthase
MNPENSAKLTHIVSFGCQMSRHDSEVVRGLLSRAGYGTSETLEGADIILFHTCCVRENAEQRLYSRISQLKRLKEERPDLILGVGGCVAQKEKASLTRRFPHVDLVFGTSAVADIASLIERVEAGERPLVETPEDGPDPRSDLAMDREGSPLHAWVSIMRGCDNYCSYCIVPYVRGRQRSKSPDRVIEEVRALAEKGVVEITLLGQNVNSYGMDLKPATSFASLLESLDPTSDLLRLRFTTSHPKDLSLDLMRAMRDLPKVCEHIHLPPQSGSSRILKMMNRGYTSEEYIAKVEKLRELVPDVSITADLIVGFPGETDEDFAETRSLVERVRFDGAYIFKYSKRSGTAAADFEDTVDPEAMVSRHRELLELQKVISKGRLEEFVGSTHDVLAESVDTKREGNLMGRTRNYRVASFPGDESLIGKECRLEISRLDGWTLIGESSIRSATESGGDH